MRKENLAFNVNFLSEPGAGILHNNDYYGCSELEEFACYVVADGLQSGNDKSEDLSARLAVEAVITAFNAQPSIGRKAMARYLTAAHEALRDNKGKKRRRASITVVVTNYKKLRYGYAGNCRFNLYRGGKLIEESKDHFLSWEVMEGDQLPKDKIAYREERNNLNVHCGTLKTFSPTVSKAIKLHNADVFSLFTRGIWENANTNDMLSSVQMAENDPQEASRRLERLLLDATPINRISENYTVCFIFVDKGYLDPKQGKRRKRIINISIIALIIIVALIVVLISYNRWHTKTQNDMQIAYHNGVEYIHESNFILAKEELETAYGFADKLRDKKYKGEINNHILLVNAIIYADDLFGGKSYEQSLEAYDAAVNQSRYADNLAIDYIETRREKAAGYMNVHEYIYLGDSLANTKDWDNAEAKYLAARSLASRLYYTDGEKEADDALDALYQLKQQEIEEQKEQAQAEIAAAGFIIEGDNALRDGDLVAATLFYQLARDTYVETGNEDIVASIDQKLALVDIKVTQNEYQLEYAADYVQAGDEMAEQGEYIDAKRFYLLAREIYANLREEVKQKEVQAKIDMVDTYLEAGSLQAD